VPGNLTFVKLKKLVQTGKGKAELKTLAGENLTAMLNGPNNITITDAKGNTADITIYDVIQSNGVIHSIDKVLMP
jgi:uncharacterized surface protein with fasciclin (FAS1) repeats